MSCTDEPLTEKQRANRLYYVRHAARIREQKRAAYRAGKKPQRHHHPKARRPRPEQAVMVNPYRQPGDNPARFPTSAADQREVEIRRKIEDWLLAKELGLDSVPD